MTVAGTQIKGVNMSNEIRSAGSVANQFGRRSFVKWSGVTAIGVGAVAGLQPVAQAPADGRADVDATVWSVCTVNCHCCCPLRVQVKDGVVVRVLPDNTGSDEFYDQQVRACVRGRSIRQRIYSPDRLKRPLRRRPGTKRGAGDWDEIGWDEAFDVIAAQMKRTIDTYGNEALWVHYGTGTRGGNILHRTLWHRLLNMVGGRLRDIGSYSWAQVNAAAKYHYGEWVSSNSMLEAQRSRLQVMFGNNPLETRMSGGGTIFDVQQVRKHFDVPTIVIDPRYTDTAVGVADTWIPIRPGTDGALIAAMILVMVTEKLHDQAFLDKYCVGFDEQHLPAGAPAGSSYLAYLTGDGPDGIRKTPAWATRITGVPEDQIVRLARQIGTTKPVAISQGWGPQRQANGEATARAIFTLAAVTGSVGIPGGGTGAFPEGYQPPIAKFPAGDNPVKTGIPVFQWQNAIERPTELTAKTAGVEGADALTHPIKFMINYAGNTLVNQHSDANAAARMLEDDTVLEFILGVDSHMTPSSRFSDILLPDAMSVEQTDLNVSRDVGEMGFVLWSQPAIKPMFESRPVYEMCIELAKRLGVEQQFTEGRTQAEWVQELLKKSREKVPDLPSEAQLRTQGIFRLPNPKKFVVPFADFRADPQANPLQTPSGKIEIYSPRLAEMAATWEFPAPQTGDRITAVPEYVETWEGAEAARKDPDHPLQLIGHHYKGRTHSSYANLPWTKEAHPQKVWLNQLDAAERGIVNGDTVEVFNDRGRIRVSAFVTPRITPGVVSVPQGAWYEPDKDGVDVGGCVNTLTRYHPSPIAKANPQHTNLCQVVKVG